MTNADETPGTWHTPATMRAAWRELPSGDAIPGEAGFDLVAGARTKVIERLAGQGLPVPDDDAVLTKHRQAQVFYARAQHAVTNANPGNDQLGTPSYQVRAGEFIRQAEQTLGYGVVFG